jgi:hypothetical protein
MPGAFGLAVVAWLAAALVVAGCATAIEPSGAPASTAASPAASLPTGSEAPSPGTGSPTADGSGACGSPGFTALITRWEGAAGSLIAHVEATNGSSVACQLPEMSRVQLVDSGGTVLIDSATAAPGSPAATAAPTGTISVAPGAAAQVLVRTGNYCGSAPATPLTVVFVLAGGGSIVAAAPSPSDTTVPSCLGEPGSPGSIEMQAWTTG